MLLSSLGAEQDIDLDTASGMFAGGEESDLQDALGAGLTQDETALLTDDDEAAASMAALLNAQMPAESSEALALPQAVWATMQQAAASAEAQESATPGAGMALPGGEAASAKPGQAGAKRAGHMGLGQGQGQQEGKIGQAARTAQADGQAETNPAATAAASAAVAQGARSKAQASAGAERAAQQMANMATAVQSATTQAAAPAAQRPVSWTQRVAAAQQRAQGTEASKSSAARSGDAARAGMQAARDGAGATAVQEWSAWADADAARFERSGEFRPATTDWTAGGMNVTGSAVPDGGSATGSIGAVRPEDGMPEGAVAPEVEVAEQVTYWVGRGARNASISVQGLTENPIHIRIVMEGQEASIQFLAEQEQTREVLSEATPHLRELLEREGLTLGEVSVGNSAAHQPGGAGDREASSGGAGRGGRDGKAAEQEEAIVARPAARASALPSGRSVDLFV